MKNRSSVWSLGLLVAIALMAAPATAQVSLGAGDDGWTTPNGGTSVDLSQFGPVAGAFGAASVTPSVVSLKGKPIDSANLGNIDTIVRRLEDANFGSGRSAGTALQFIALSLQSTAPVTVTYANGSSESWNLRVCLSKYGGGSGEMELTLDNGDGGSFNSAINVLPRLIFSRSGSADVVIDCGGGGCKAMTVSSTASDWALEGGPGGFDPGAKNVAIVQADLVVDSDCDGTPETKTWKTTNFFPGFEANKAAGFPAVPVNHDHPPVAQHKQKPPIPPGNGCDPEDPVIVGLSARGEATVAAVRPAHCAKARNVAVSGSID